MCSSDLVAVEKGGYLTHGVVDAAASLAQPLGATAQVYGLGRGQQHHGGGVAQALDGVGGGHGGVHAQAHHSLPTEQYNQDVVSLGMHSAVTAAEALECLRNATAMVLLAATQAVDLRGGPARLGPGSRRVYDAVRGVAPFLERDRPMEGDVAAMSEAIQSGRLGVG